MIEGEHSAILSTFIKLPFAIKTFVLSIFEWPLKTGLTLHVDIILVGVMEQEIHTYHPGRRFSS